MKDLDPVLAQRTRPLRCRRVGAGRADADAAVRPDVCVFDTWGILVPPDLPGHSSRPSGSWFRSLGSDAMSGLGHACPPGADVAGLSTIVRYAADVAAGAKSCRAMHNQLSWLLRSAATAGASSEAHLGAGGLRDGKLILRYAV